MEIDEYAGLDAVALRDLLRGGEVTAGEVEDVARRALDLVNPEVNGLALPPFAPALERAPDGPLAGVPFLLKDSGPMAAGVPFACGSRSVRGVVAQRDSDLMRRVRAAGLVTLGLTTVPELCLSFATESKRYGPTRNPWAEDRGVGGSSGGAAALVAAGAVPVAHANDGAGSIRVPASCCGLVGLKPSRGRTPCGPDVGEANFGMSYEFALTRTVRDTAVLLDLFHGPGVGDKYTAPPPCRPYSEEVTRAPGALRIALTTAAWHDVPVDPEVAAATVRAASTLEDLGHTVTPGGPSVDVGDVLHSLRGQAVAAAAPMLRAPRRPDPAGLEAVSRAVLEEVQQWTALDLVASFDAQNRVTRRVAAFFVDHDVLVTPTVGRLPAPHGTLDYDDPRHTLTTWLQTLLDHGPFTAVFNVAGQPAISLPLGHSSAGLPIGVQLVAGYGREDVLLRLAAQLELALPWCDRIPVCSARRPGVHGASVSVGPSAGAVDRACGAGRTLYP